jgi:hypothetical protein
MSMAKKTKTTRSGNTKKAQAPAERIPLAPDDRVLASNLALHDLFQQQTARMLERADLSEEQRQSILIGMNCPCCGAGGFSFTAKLKR